MRKILCFFLGVAFLMLTSDAFALVRTRNVDIDEGGFGYKVAYQFATENVGASRSAVEIHTAGETGSGEVSYYYTMPFKGSIVAVSIASSSALTDGSATADVTINGAVTGIRVALDGGATTLWDKSGEKADHTQYNYRTIQFDDDSPEDWGGTCGQGAQACQSGYEYGKATPLVAGDRIGVKLTTSSGLAPADSAEFNITVMVLQ